MMLLCVFQRGTFAFGKNYISSWLINRKKEKKKKQNRLATLNIINNNNVAIEFNPIVGDKQDTLLLLLLLRDSK